MKTTNGTKYNIYVKKHNSEIHCTACLLLCVCLYVLCGLWDVCLDACSMYYLCAGARGLLWRSFLKCCLPLFLKQGLPLAMNLMRGLDWLSHQAKGDSCLCLDGIMAS